MATLGGGREPFQRPKQSARAAASAGGAGAGRAVSLTVLSPQGQVDQRPLRARGSASGAFLTGARSAGKRPVSCVYSWVLTG